MKLITPIRKKLAVRFLADIFAQKRTLQIGKILMGS